MRQYCSTVVDEQLKTRVEHHLIKFRVQHHQRMDVHLFVTGQHYETRLGLIYS